MTTDLLPISLGFHVLALDGESNYRGIDRPLWPLTTEEEHAGLAGGSSAFVYAMRLAWSLKENRSIQRSGYLASEVCDLLNAVGKSSEVIFACAYFDFLNPLHKIGPTIGQETWVGEDGLLPIKDWAHLGFDVSVAVRNYHSMLKQPGFPESDLLRSALGSNGLISDLNRATELARIGSEVLTRTMWAIGLWAPAKREV